MGIMSGFDSQDEKESKTGHDFIFLHLYTLMLMLNFYSHVSFILVLLCVFFPFHFL